MPNLKNEIWIFCDDRPGNYFQAIALGNELSKQLNLPTKIIEISYGFFSFLPNFILRSSLFGFSKKTKSFFKTNQDFPKYAISAGRRSVSALLGLKRKSKNQTKIIQIMNPEVAFSQFDFIILPSHDKIKSHSDNVIQTIGSLSKINDESIASECKKFENEFLPITKIKIAVLLGGKSRHGEFDETSAIFLSKQLSEIANNMNAILFVSNSRRTGDKISDLINENLKCDFKFFDYKKIAKEKNPYLAIVGFSDYFIVSGDSVSMISEVCSTGKPVYIFDQKNISSKKHRKFHENLFLENYAKKLDAKFDRLEKFVPKKLNETKKVAFIIKTKLNI